MNRRFQEQLKSAFHLWDDIRVPVTSTKLGGSKDPDFTLFKKNEANDSQGVFLYWFDASSEQELYFSLQLPHGWDNTTNLSPHVHWTPSATADGNPVAQKVKWGLEYTWADIGDVFGFTQIITGHTPTPNDANVVAGKHYLTEFPEITPPSSDLGVSSMLLCRIFRDATDATYDTYESDAGLLEIDFHYQFSQNGSRQEYIY
jgi:hypothetical protein